MPFLKRGFTVFLGLYLLYLLKTALGINISDRYTAWNILKAPLKCQVFSAYCRKG